MVRVWKGDPEALAALSYIEDTGFRSKRKEVKPKAKKPKQQDRLKFFNHSLNFGMTNDGVYIHKDDIVAGEPRRGAIAKYDVVDTPKGKRGYNVTFM